MNSFNCYFPEHQVITYNDSESIQGETAGSGPSEPPQRTSQSSRQVSVGNGANSGDVQEEQLKLSRFLSDPGPNKWGFGEEARLCVVIHRREARKADSILWILSLTWVQITQLCDVLIFPKQKVFIVLPKYAPLTTGCCFLNFNAALNLIQIKYSNCSISPLHEHNLIFFFFYRC